MSELATLFKRQLKREFLLSVRQPKLLVYAALFFLMTTVFFPLTMPPNPLLLRSMVSGIVWIATQFALLLATVNVFQQDYEHGVIEQWLLRGVSISRIVAAKLIIHWSFTLLAILIFCPFLSLLINLNSYETFILFISLLLGTPALVFLCGLAAAFSAGMQQKGIMMALILFPLTIPLLIFGSGTLSAAMQGFAIGGYLAMLLAISLLAVAFLPFAIAAVIRISLVD